MGSADASDPADRIWISGIFKQPVDGPVYVGRTNLAGDGQADLAHHGGPDMAVLAYSADHYESWRSELELKDPPWGGFGENLTIGGLTEESVCIGDVWQAGEVLFQVSQPRQPCWKLGRRWRRPELPKRVIETGRSGWYLRVLREGQIERGLPILLQDRPHARWTVAKVARQRYDKRADLEVTRQLAELADLSLVWRDEFLQRL